MFSHKIILILLTTLLASSLQADLYHIDGSAGLAYDSNVYRAPSENYIDFFADTSGNTTVNPEVQSGFFIPLILDAVYDKKLTKQWRLIGQYDFNSLLYLENKFSNADKQSHKAKLGTKYKIVNFKKRKSSIYTGLLLANRQQDYYDRDTGEKKLSGTSQADVSDLYNYNSQGLELKFDYWRKLNWNLQLGLRFEQRNHDPVGAGSEYDNHYSRFDLEYDYRINKTFRLAIDYSNYSFDYDERHARNLSGQLFSSNPLLKYDYSTAGLFVKHRINNQFSLIYGYELTTRRDNNVGYNDYDLTETSVSIRFRPNEKFLLKARVTIKQQDYPNAWNFDRDPTLYTAISETRHKSADSANLTTRVDYKVDEQLNFFAEIEFRDENNTDSRYEYTREIIMLGARKSFF